jgi:hypothetical protein
VLQRRGALAPERVLGAGLWPYLREAREDGMEREAGVRELRRIARADLGRIRPGGGRGLLPVGA